MTIEAARADLVSGPASPAGTARSSRLQACTIVARNYLPHARVLARTFSEHHAGSRLAVLVIDDPLALATSPIEPFDVVDHDSLGLTRLEFRRMALIYDVMELSTAIKPWLLASLLGAGAGCALYLDPDIEVFSSLDVLADAAGRAGIALTPHILEPLPRDDRYPSEQDLLIAGVFNLGAIAVAARPETGSFLDWWKGHLRRDAIVDPGSGRFTDQRPIDLVPALFDHEVVRDPGANVAYWNAHSRPLSTRLRRLVASDSPLRFLHYSGFDPDAPHLLSRHGRDRPRVLLSEHPLLAGLCASYADSLRAEGWEVERGTPYGWSALPDGTPLDRSVRRAFRQALLDAEARGSPGPPDPIGPGWCERFLDWLAAPGHDGVPRAAKDLRNRRADLTAAFPDPGGADADAFTAWLDHSLPREGGVPLRVIERMEERRRSATRTAGRRPCRGTTAVVGYLRAELGIGEAARRVAISLEAVGERVALVDHLGACTSRRQAAMPATTGALADADVAVVGINADMTAGFALGDGAELLRDRYVVGYWFWEVDKVPRSFGAAFRHVDEVWVASSYIAAAIGAVAPVPVHVVPLPVLVPEVEPLDGARLGLDGRPLVSLVCDLASVVERKNPLGAIEAFLRAGLADHEGELVIKTVHGDRQLCAIEALRHVARRHDRVHVVDGFWSAGAVAGLIDASACYLSLSRSEGLGLTVADAVALDRPCIATAQGGVLDLSAEDADWLLVHGEQVAVGPGNEPYPADASWLEPDLDAAAGLLAGVLHNPRAAEARAARAGARLRERFSPTGCGTDMVHRLTEIRRRPAAAGA